MRKDKKPYRILVVEDNLGDWVIIENFLSEQISAPTIIHVDSFKEAAEILNTATTAFDVIVLDLSLPDNSGQDLITAMLPLVGSSPIIILTGYSDVSFSITSISQGIMDYLLKDDLTAASLYKSIIYSIERKKNSAELEASEKRYSDLFELSPQPMCLYEMLTFRFIQVNKAAIDHYGYSRQEFMTMTLLDLLPKEDQQKSINYIVSQQRVLNETYPGRSKNYKKTGELIEVETFSTPIIINSKACTLVIAIDVTEKNQHEHNIIKAIIKTQEDERYEIGGELHDNVCQLLAACRFKLDMIKKKSFPTETKPLFDQCDEYLTLALQEIRNLSHQLAPAFFDDSTLEEAIRRLLTTFEGSKTVQYSLHFDTDVYKYPISMEAQLNLYRILQEQLRNIFKYAHATIIKISVTIGNNELQMKISDNGIGFDVQARYKGIGLANMRRRTELFSGHFDLVSSPGNGCKIIVSIPLTELSSPPDNSIMLKLTEENKTYN